MIDRSSTPRIALAHDWLVGLRGGERVLDRLARAYGPAPLYTMVHDGRPLTEAIDACRIVTSPLQHFPGAAGRWRRHYLPLMPWAVDRLRVALVRSRHLDEFRAHEVDPAAGGYAAPLLLPFAGAIPLGAGGGLCGRLGRAPALARTACLRRAAATMGPCDGGTRVTRFVANSRHTAARIRRCFDREADVIHPPVRTHYFTSKPEIAREDWFLVVAALEPYKRTDLVVEAARKAGFRLKVVGGGSQAEAIAQLGGSTVEVLGRVSDDALLDLFRRAKALVFPQLEDFGIIAVEAAATGCPVLAFRGGGAEETVVAGATGLFFDAQTIDAIADAAMRLEQVTIDPAACRAHAENFSEARFEEAMDRIVNELLD